MLAVRPLFHRLCRVNAWWLRHFLTCTYTQRNTRMRKAEFVEDRKQFENKYLRNERLRGGSAELYAAIDESAVTIGKVSEPVEG